MKKTILRFLPILLIVSILMTSGQVVYAQTISLPAEVNKSFSPISITSGGVSLLRVTIFNPNGFQLTNASWIDNLIGIQPGLSIANPVGLTNNCGGSVSAVAGSTTFSITGGIVPAQSGITPGSCTVSINVTSTTAGNLINTITAGALTSTGGGTNVTNTTPASATLNVIRIQPPTVSKSFNPGTIWIGGTSRLSIVIRNNDSSTTLNQASLVDNLPANVFLATPVAPTLTGCGGLATLTAVSGGTSVALNNSTIVPNSTCTITVSVTSNVQGAYTNRIPANALQTQEGLTNATQASARLNVDAIGITKSFLPATFSAGGTTTLTITLQNPTGSPYTGVNVSDTLPGTVLSLISGSATTTCGGTVTTTLPRTVSLTGGTIPPGNLITPGTCTISVQVTAPAGTPSGGFTNTIPAGGLTTDQGVSNLRSANATVTVRGTDVTGVKTFSPASITPGSNSRLRIDVFAPSDTNLTNFSLTDNLPSGITVSNSTAPAITGCGAAPPRIFTAPTGSTSISLTGGLILAGQRCRIDVFVTSSKVGVHTNIIPPANITNNENRAPTNSLTANLTVANIGNLSIDLVKGFDPLTVFNGSASTMSVKLINPGNVALSGITFTDNMPSGMIIATPASPNVGTCGGSISAVAGAGSFLFSGGSLPAFANCTLTLSVTMTVNGNLTNSIPASTITTVEGATNPQAAAASLTNLPDVSVSKSFSPNPIKIGSYSALTITIQNTGNIPLSGMGLSDQLPGVLPSGLEIADSPAPAPVNNCSGTLTAAPGTQLIQLTDGALGASSLCTIVVSITGNVPGGYQNTIPIGVLKSTQNITNKLPATDKLVVQGIIGGLTKTIVNSDLASTTGANVAIGEIVTYQVSISVPPGTHTNATLVDTLERGLAFIGCDNIDAPGLTTSIAGDFTSICSTPTTSDAGGGTSMDIDRLVTYDFGTLTNAGQSDTTMTITYRAIVLNIGTNTDGTNLNNSALWNSDNTPLGPVQTEVKVVEPELVVEKTADVNVIANGSEVVFTLALSHTPSSHSDAFDVVLNDILPAGLDFVANSLDCNNGEQDPTSCMYDPVTRTVSATWNTFTLLPTGDHGIVQFRVIGNTSIPANGSVKNTATTAWTSLPGDHSTPQSFSNPHNPFATERGYDPKDKINIYSNSASLTLTSQGSNNGGNNRSGGNKNKPATTAPIASGFLIPVTGFAPDMVTDLSQREPVAYANTSMTLEIPALHVNIPIVGVPQKDGRWSDVSWLSNQAGWLEGSAFPSWKGNSVLVSHVYLSNGKPGPFAKLHELKTRDQVIVHAFGQKYVFEVLTNAIIAPNDKSVMQHEESPWITLVTCTDYDQKTGTYKNRFIVRAVLVKVSTDK